MQWIPLIVKFPFLTTKLFPILLSLEHDASGKTNVCEVCHKTFAGVNISIKHMLRRRMALV